MEVFVGDVKIATAVKGQTYRIRQVRVADELADGAVRSNFADCVVRPFGNVEVPISVEGQVVGFIQSTREQTDGAVWRYAANVVIERVADIEIAAAVEGDALNIVEAVGELADGAVDVIWLIVPLVPSPQET